MKNLETKPSYNELHLESLVQDYTEFFIYEMYNKDRIEKIKEIKQVCDFIIGELEQ